MGGSVTEGVDVWAGDDRVHARAKSRGWDWMNWIGRLRAHSGDLVARGGNDVNRWETGIKNTKVCDDIYRRGRGRVVYVVQYQE